MIKYFLFTVDGTAGALFIGFAFSCVLFGVLCSQVATYLKNYPEDGATSRILVLSILFLETVGQIFIAHFMYHDVIMDYGDFLTMVTTKVVWTAIAQVIPAFIVGAITNFCFAVRVWKLNGRNLVIPSLVSLLILAHLGLALAFCIKAYKLSTFARLHELQSIGTPSLALGLVIDSSLALALCYYLRTLQRGNSRMTHLLSVYAISTGAMTSVVSIVTLALYKRFPSSFYFMASYFVLSRMHAVSFLSGLNAREVVASHVLEPCEIAVLPNPYASKVVSYKSDVERNDRRSATETCDQFVVKAKMFK